MLIMTSVSEVSVERVRRLLTEDPEIQLWDGNQPQFAILSMERYRNLTAATSAVFAPSDIPATAEVSSRPASPVPSDTPTQQEKIGAFVRRTLRDYCARNRLPKEEVERLCALYYSHDTFGIPYPLLKRYNPALPITEQIKDELGFNRYYGRPSDYYPLPFYGAKYLLCNHWVERNRASFEEWARRWE